MEMTDELKRFIEGGVGKAGPVDGRAVKVTTVEVSGLPKGGASRKMARKIREYLAAVDGDVDGSRPLVGAVHSRPGETSCKAVPKDAVRSGR